MQEEILLQVNKPARYIGREWNVSRKEFDNAQVRFALGFPDLYEVGMSNLGIRILYGILNNIPGVACERFFAPGEDLEKNLRSQNKEIFSLESGRGLKEFDIIGFSLGSELGYTNVLNILELGGIALQSSLRDNSHPLIIGGGPCVMNPEPMHEFFDLFVIGEAEDALGEIVEIYRQNKKDYKSAQISKADLLFKLSQVGGVYVPSFYEVSYDHKGRIEGFEPNIKGIPPRVRKRFVKDLDRAFFPSDWIVPYIQIVHDRITLEVMRGCANRCRFCQARSQYYPLRQRSVENILDLAEKAYRNSGYEDISLCGLSVSDYSRIEELLTRLVDLSKPRAVGVSLPSLKAKAIVGNFSSLIASIKKTGLTFAPEAGSKKLREVMAKDFDEEEFFCALEKAYASGYQHVKLYFMVGLPSETEEDLDTIVDFSVRTSESRRKACGRSADVNISINALIPKPHTAFQWLAMEDNQSIKSKQDYLRGKIKKYKRLNLNFHNLNMGFIEGVLSRGDRRLSQVICSAFKKGARFDAWSDHFSLLKWLEAFQEAGIDPNFYTKEIAIDKRLPWDFIDVGISRESFLEEFNKTVVKRETEMYNLGTLNQSIEP